jgi:hypothetical protein
VNKDKVKLIICAMVCITVIICGILFWPTLYRYDSISDGKKKISIRINRITGTTEIFGKTVETLDWKKPFNPEDYDHPKALPTEEIAKLVGNKIFGGSVGQFIHPLDYVLPNSSYISIPDKNDFSFKSEVYNGTKYPIGKLLVVIEAKNKDWKTRWKRRYQADFSGQIQPFSSWLISVKPSDANGVAVYIWSIDEAISP